MATLEKLVKAFEALKVFQPEGAVLDPKKKDVPVTKKDKIANCNAIADCICSTSLRNASDFPKFLGVAMETFFSMCDDPESDVRIVADECLNKTVKTIMENNLGRLQVELYKEIKKNGSQRSLRGALWRFADTCHLIRPQKCRPYVVNLLPCLARICRRPEESVQDTLAQSMEKICPVLMGFTNDNEIKILLKAFLPNLKLSSATSRRTAASALGLVCQYSRKPLYFLSYLLNTLLDLVLPIEESTDTYTVLGVLLALRHLIPQVAAQEASQQQGQLKGNLGRKVKDTEVKINVRQLQQVFETLLHYSGHTDHNVVTASLETLQQLFKTMPRSLMNVLVTKHGIRESAIYGLERKGRSGSQSKIPSLADDMILEDDLDGGSDVGSTHRSSGTSGIGSSLSNNSDTTASDLESNLTENDETDGGIEINVKPPHQNIVEEMELEGGAYSSIDIGDIEEDKSMSRSESAYSTTSLSEDLQNQELALPLDPVPLRKGLSDDKLLNQGEVEENETETVENETETRAESEQASEGGMREGDLGSLMDDDLPLVYCVRMLCHHFLLTGYPQGLVPDRKVRVSVKALAIGCVAGALSISPRLLLQKLNKSSTTQGPLQDVKDILLYATHSDPQLKGNTALLLGNFIQAAMTESRGRIDKWIKQEASKDFLRLDGLMGLLLSILEDESPVATRLALVAMQGCLHQVLDSRHGETGLKAVLSLMRLSSNTYWLVKVELVELLSSLDYKVILYLESLCLDVRRGNNHYIGVLNIQDKVLNSVLVELLGDEDHRVRQATASAFLRIVPCLFFPVDSPQQDPVVTMARDTSAENLEPIMHEWSQPLQPLVHGLVQPYEYNLAQTPSATVEASLSRVVALVSHKLNISTSKYLTNGCLHTLSRLADQYKTTVYPSAWNCVPEPPSSSVAAPGGRDMNSPGGGVLPMVISLLTFSHTAQDPSTHQDILRLGGNLMAGLAYRCLRPAPVPTEGEGEESHWIAVGDRTLVTYMDTLLTHVARLLNVFTHVIEEQSPGPPQAPRTSLPSLPVTPSLSPIKRRAKGIRDDITSQGQTTVDGKAQAKEAPKEAEKDRGKKEALGSFYNHPHYVKIYDVLKSVYASYKISLDLSSSEKFGVLLSTTLTVLAQLLEMAGLADIGRHAEELLGYLKSTASVGPRATVLCVQQLLKALFGTNLASQWEPDEECNGPGNRSGKPTRLTLNMRPGLYHCCFTMPYTQFTQCLASATFRAATHLEQDDSSWMSWVRKRAERKVPAVLRPGSKTDKSTIAGYIRLFEPLVIKALKQYTLTSNLDLQRQVLDLLIQLVQLRVNYCLLDSDQIFIGFVIKQFEFIEEGQIRNSEVLVPHIFNFLVLLSYEKYHSKSIIGFPKIIQLCDGMMASGQDPNTHAIPALQAIVQDLFVVRATNKADLNKEIDTQREVVISMLLKLLRHYQVLEMLIVVLHQSHKEGEDKWKRLSRQVTDMVLPLLARQQLNVDNQTGVDVVHRLFEVVAPSVFRPVDILLKTLFAPPEDLGSSVGVERWLALNLIVLRVLISQSKEETILSRLKELGVGMYLYTDIVSRHRRARDDPLNVKDTPLTRHGLNPQQLFARFLFQVVGICGQELSSRCVRLPVSERDTSFLCQELSHLLLYFMHMFQSGIFRKVANTAMTMLDKPPPDGFFSIGEINTFFKDLVALHPTLTLQWCNVLILLNYDNQSYWMDLLLTNKRYVPAKPRSSLTDSMDVLLSKTKSCSQEVARRGSLILYCDFVCENLNDAEKMTWVIINHVNDLVLLSAEPPVQDFIGAIHRNSAASGLLIQAIHSRSEHISKPVRVRQMLLCLDPVHGSQSGALLVLLVDKFLNTPHLAVARLCDSIACRRVERLLAETTEVCRQQLSLQDLNKMFDEMREHGLDRRHERLVSLLRKLRDTAYPSTVATATATTKPGVGGGEGTGLQCPLSVIEDASQTIDKDLFERFTRALCCQSTVQARQCVLLLDKLDYSAMLNIIIHKEFHLSVLRECMSLGLSQTLVLQRNVESLTSFSDSGGTDTSDAANSPSRTNPTSDLLRAAKVALFRHLNAIVNTLPVPHRVMNYSHNMSRDEENYSEKMEDLLHDVTWFEALFPLAAAVVELLVALKSLPRQPDLPVESVKDVARFSILCSEVCYWMIQQGQFPTMQQLQMTLNLLCLVLQNKDTLFVIGQKAQVTWVCSAIRTVYQILSSLLLVPGERLVTLPHQESQDDLATTGFDDMHNAIKACDQISELVQCLKTHLNPASLHASVPLFLSQAIRDSIIGLARLPLVNSYARTPPLVWKLGWLPSPSGDLKTRLPPLPLEYLQEKDILREFIFRVNTLGWTSRQQFEETWMGLLGVLNPVQREGEPALDVEEDVDRTQCQVEATWGITALLIQTLLTPISGNPSGGTLDLRARSKPLAFLHTRVGQKLTHVRSILESERQTVDTSCTQRCQSCQSRSWEAEPQKHLCVQNLERFYRDTGFHLGQISVETTWAFLGMLEQMVLASSESDSAPETPVTTPDHTPVRIVPPVHKVSYSLDSVSRSSIASGLDVHSCLQFLLDLYGHFLSPNPEPKVPLMLLNQTLKSVLALSDVFTERSHFEWMLNTLLELYRVHPPEDEISIQYLVVAICKAAAVVGMDMQKYERVLKLVELHLRSTHLPTKISTLYGCLYLLEAGMTEVTQGILPHLTEYLLRTLSSITQNTILSQHHVMVMWSCAFYICEHFSDELKESDFPSKVIQTCVSSLQGGDALTSLPVYLEVVTGLERMVLADVLTQQDIDAVIKLAVERLSSPCAQRSLAALGLVLTAMYSGKQTDQWTPTSLLDQPDFHNSHIAQDPESLIVAMERVNVLFDRIRKGCPYEARVMTRILPLFLTDFFPPQDIMNKVIGEFLSSQQPHPTLMAGVVFKVFECLLCRKQQSVVQDWVMLSLSNFTQRNPVSMAIWSLSCFFCSASPNPWLRAFFPHLLSRMGRLDACDERLFLQSATDFYTHLSEPATQHTFRSTFHGVASITPLYSKLVSICDDVIKT